jgi:hypothetical protein
MDIMDIIDTMDTIEVEIKGEIKGKIKGEIKGEIKGHIEGPVTRRRRINIEEERGCSSPSITVLGQCELGEMVEEGDSEVVTARY